MFDLMSFYLLKAQAETVITADEGVRGGKIINLKKTVDEAVKVSNCIKRVFVYKRTGNEVPRSSIDICLEEVGTINFKNNILS